MTSFCLCVLGLSLSFALPGSFFSLNHYVLWVYSEKTVRLQFVKRIQSVVLYT